MVELMMEEENIPGVLGLLCGTILALENEPVPSVHGLTDETEFTTFLANHLFGKLATTTTYTISEKKSGKKTKQCLCGKEGCTLTGRYGDTSIGNPTVWHGSPDIILNNSLPIEPITEGSGGPDGKLGVVVHKKSSSLCKNPQMIAETIVFSFLQKRLHPERDNFLTPCIGVGFSEFLGVGFSELFIMLYDSEHDVLLESCKIPLSSPTQPNKFNMTAVLLSWLVVNYKFLCTGLTDEMKAFYKADFFEKAGPKLQVYNELLSMGNVAEVNLNDPSLPQYCFKDNSYLLARRRKLKEVVEEVENRFSQAGFSGGD
ncbi:hypothetical protein FSP39_010905 [Pinctada imbricata]|uniref:Uncharacterized protein n=1 Tax=Pinctada imbricata TaxID=66713 RepID=A0AA89BZF9_PINIB|nr:hypothetical protein FSP39_010905 [Pinctada imbricata]